MSQFNPDLEAIARAQEQGRKTLEEISDRERDQRGRAKDNPTPQYASSSDILKVMADRRFVAQSKAADARAAKLAEEYLKPVPADTSNPYELLSVGEIYELNRLTELEAKRKAEYEAQFASLGSWSLLHSECPATPEVGAALATYCRERGLSCAHDNLTRAWEELQKNGVRPNYSEANRREHLAHVEELKAAGIRVEATPDPRTATAAEMDSWLRTQPPPTLQNFDDVRPDIFHMPVSEVLPQEAPARIPFGGRVDW